MKVVNPDYWTALAVGVGMYSGLTKETIDSADALN